MYAFEHYIVITFYCVYDRLRHAVCMTFRFRIGYKANIEQKCGFNGVRIFSDFLFAQPIFSNPPSHPDLHVGQIEKTVRINGRPLRGLHIELSEKQN